MQRPEDRPEPVQRGYSGGGYHNGGGVSMNKVLISVLCGIGVSIIAVYMFLIPNLVSKDDFTKNFQAVTAESTKLRTEVTSTVESFRTAMNALPTTLTAQVNSVISQATNSLSSQITSMQSQVNNMASLVRDAATKADITNLSSTIASLKASLDTTNTKLADAQTKLATAEGTITSLTTRVTALEAGGGGSGTTHPQVLTTSIKSIANSLARTQTTSLSGVTTTTTNTLSGSIRLAVTNTSAKDVTDALLDVTFGFSPSIPNLGLGNCTVQLVGGSIPFTAQMIDPSMVEFYNGAWGFKVPANQTLNVFLTLTMTYTATQNDNTAVYNPYAWASTYYYQVTADASS